LHLLALTKPPSILLSLFSSLVWKMPAADRSVYLTFDDGPHPVSTRYVLDLLLQHGAKATFFCLGKNVAAHPDIFQRILSEGHAVGNHSHSHPDGWSTPAGQYVADVGKAAALIPSGLFRPPYGRITPTQVRELKKEYKIVMWSVLSKDYDAAIPTAEVIRNVTANISPGAIVVFHDHEKTKERLPLYLPQVLNFLKEENYVTGVL